MYVSCASGTFPPGNYDKCMSVCDSTVPEPPSDPIHTPLPRPLRVRPCTHLRGRWCRSRAPAVGPRRSKPGKWADRSRGQCAGYTSAGGGYEHNEKNYHTLLNIIWGQNYRKTLQEMLLVCIYQAACLYRGKINVYYSVTADDSNCLSRRHICSIIVSYLT